MNPHSLTAVILVAGMVAVGWGIVWHERWSARRDARRQHPSNWAPETDAAIDEAIDITRADVDELMDDIESYLSHREPPRR